MTKKVRVAFVACAGVSTYEANCGLGAAYAAQLNRLPNTHAKVFDDSAAALDFLSKDLVDVCTLVYLSISEAEEAGKIAAKNPGVRVIIFTGADPQKGTVQIVRKTWITDSHALTAIVG